MAAKWGLIGHFGINESLAKIDDAPQIINWKLHKARTVIGWFSKGIAHGKDIRNGLQDITCVADVRRLLDAARVRMAA